MTDRTTNWPESFPLKDITATTVAKYYEGWIVRFVIPEKLTTQRQINGYRDFLINFVNK